MTVQQIGPYRLIQILGAGGMGIVYLAEHLKSANRVALKTVRLPNVGMIRGIRREIGGLRRINHPGIVRILDEGIDQGMPWYCMELLDGKPLSSVVRDAWSTAVVTEDQSTANFSAATSDKGGDSPVSTAAIPGPATPTAVPAHHDATALASASLLPRILTVVRSLCNPLAAIHGEGMVHRDLKPGNILIRADGSPVILDFGLLSRFSGTISRDSVSVEELQSGTAHYMAPEQIRGEFVDARADLYSLGCILFELVVGRPPFGGSTITSILMNHLTVAPVVPPACDGWLPDELVHLILGLLVKDPRRRIGYAEDVSRILKDLGAQDLYADGPFQRRHYLYRPGFSGRRAEMNQVAGIFAELTAGRGGGCLFISGESGVGKSRLAQEASRIAQLQDWFVFVGECLDTGGRPFEGFRLPLLAVGDICREGGAAATARYLGQRGAILARYEPSIADVTGLGGTPLPAIPDPEREHLRLYSAVALTLRELAMAKPILLIVDDLQWADELTIGFFEFLVRGDLLRTKPLLVMGLARSEELRERLRRFSLEPGVTTMALARIDESTVSALVGDMLGMETPPPALAKTLSRMSEGNPCFVGEFLRTAIAEGFLDRDQKGLWKLAQHAGPTGRRVGDIPLPRSLRELIGRRLDGLTDSALLVIQAAAVVGRSIRFDLLQAIVRLDEPDLFKALDELGSRNILIDENPDALRFSHDKIREVAYGRLDPSRQAIIHRTVAESLESLYASELEKWQADLGHHWEMAGEPDRARRAYLAAGNRARVNQETNHAEQLFEKYLRLPAILDREHFLVVAALAVEMHVLGKSSEALRMLEENETLPIVLADETIRFNLLHRKGKILHDLGRIDECMRVFDESLVIADHINDPIGKALLLNSKANIHGFRGETAVALDYYDQALKIARAQQDRMLEGQIMGNLAVLYRELNDLDQAMTLYDAALAIHRQMKDGNGEAITLLNKGNLLAAQGKFDLSLQCYDLALAIFRRSGDIRLEILTRCNIADLRHQQNNLNLAAQLYQELCQMLETIAADRVKYQVTSNFGTVQRDRGDFATALESFDRAFCLAERLGHKRSCGVISRHKAMTLRLRGDLIRAMEELDVADSFIQAVNDRDTRILSLCERGHCKLGLNQSARAEIDAIAALTPPPPTGLMNQLRTAVNRLERAQQLFDEGMAADRRGQAITNRGSGSCSLP